MISLCFFSHFIERSIWRHSQRATKIHDGLENAIIH